MCFSRKWDISAGDSLPGWIRTNGHFELLIALGSFIFFVSLRILGWLTNLLPCQILNTRKRFPAVLLLLASSPSTRFGWYVDDCDWMDISLWRLMIYRQTLVTPDQCSVSRAALSRSRLTTSLRMKVGGCTQNQSPFFPLTNSPQAKKPVSVPLAALSILVVSMATLPFLELLVTSSLRRALSSPPSNKS